MPVEKVRRGYDLIESSLVANVKFTESFWSNVQWTVGTFIFSIVLNVMCQMLALHKTLSYPFAWMRQSNKVNVHVQAHRTMTDVAMACLNPRLHGILTSLAVYETCSQSAAEFAIMSVTYFKEQFTLAHWSGQVNAANLLVTYLPNRSDEVDRQKQWEAWQRSASDQSITDGNGGTLPVPKNVWFDLFPKDIDSFFEVPLINACATLADHSDPMMSRLGIMFAHGLSGSLKFISHGQSAAQLFRFYWTKSDPPPPASCAGMVKRAAMSGAMVGLNAGMGAHNATPIKGKKPGLSKGKGMAVAVGMAIGSAIAVGITSAKANKEQCHADEVYNEEDSRHDE